MSLELQRSEGDDGPSALEQTFGENEDNDDSQYAGEASAILEDDGEYYEQGSDDTDTLPLIGRRKDDDEEDDDYVEQEENSEDDSDEGGDYDDDDEDYLVGRSRPRRAPRSAPRSRSARLRKSAATTSSIQKRTRHQSRTGNPTRKPKHRLLLLSSDEDQLEEDDEDGAQATAPVRKSPRKSVRSSNVKYKEGHSESEVEVDEDDSEEEIILPKRNGRKRSHPREDSYDEFVGEQDDDSSSPDEDLDGDDEDDDHDVIAKKVTRSTPRRRTAIVRDEDVGTADDSSNDEEPSYQSPQLQLRRSSDVVQEIKPRTPADLDSDDDEVASPLKLIECQSKVDVITCETLPPKHICYYPPNGGTCQCFALSTLRDIALATSHNFLPNGRQAFLQPPHFRSEMSAELIDQIASRFGRQAVDIHSDFYKPREERPNEDDVSDADDAAEYESHGRNVDKLLEQVHAYVNRCMGRQDVYTCPLCYTVAHKRLAGVNHRKLSRAGGDKEDGDEDSELAKLYPLAFRFDPMTVLGSVDGDRFEVAATFCFTKVSALKEHLRRDHDVDNRTVEGNDLYERFQVRKTDGLLQRYLKQQSRDNTVAQGAMMSYWFNGNNYNFVLLLSLIALATEYRNWVESDDVNDEDVEEDEEKLEAAKSFLAAGTEYFGSFSLTAPSLWRLIAEPYRKMDAVDIADFIDFDENEEEQDEEQESPQMHHRALNMEAIRQEMEDDRRLVDRYEQAALDESEDEDEDDSNKVGRDAFNDTSDEESPESEDEEYEEEEDDDWEKTIMVRKRGSIGKNRKTSAQKRRASRRVTEDPAATSPSTRLTTQRGRGSSSSKKSRRVINDSSDDGE